MRDRKLATHLLSWCIGFLFIAGGIGKLVNIHAFEFLLVVQEKLTSWLYAPYFSRILIGAEIILGLGFFFPAIGKKYIFPLSIVLLAGFSVHLSRTLIVVGNVSDCGCFGAFLSMSTSSALIKNVILILMLFYLKRCDFPNTQKGVSTFLVLSILTIAIIVFLVPIRPYRIMETKYQHNTTKAVPADSGSSTTGRKVDTSLSRKAQGRDSSLRHTENNAKNTRFFVSQFSRFRNYSTGYINPDSGTVLVCVLSLECEHCQTAAGEIAVFIREHKRDLKVVALFLGENEQVTPFMQSSGFSSPFMMLSPMDFFPLLAKSPPRIILLQNGETRGDWGGEEFSTAKLRTALLNLK